MSVTYASVLEAMGRRRAPMTLGTEVRLAQEAVVEGVLHAMNVILKAKDLQGSRRFGNTDTILCVTPRRVLGAGNGKIIIDVPFEQIVAITRQTGGAFELVADGVTYEADWMMQGKLDRAFELITERWQALGQAAAPLLPPPPAAPVPPQAVSPAAPPAPLIAVDATLFSSDDAGRRIVASLHALAAAAHRHRADSFADGEPIAPAITVVVERMQQLFARLRSRSAPQQVRVTEITYADLLGNVAKVTDAGYLGDLLAHPELWADGDTRLAAVARLLSTTGEQIVREIRDANSRATLDIDVAKAQVAAAATPQLDPVALLGGGAGPT